MLLDLLSKLIANRPPDIRASILYLWNLEIQFRDLPTQIFFLGQHIPFTPALMTAGLGLPRQEIEKAIFILEKAGCISYSAGKYRSLLFCSIPLIMVGGKNTFQRIPYLEEQKRSNPKSIKLRQLLGVA